MKKNISYILLSLALLIVNFMICFSYSNISVKIRVLLALISLIAGIIFIVLFYKF